MTLSTHPEDRREMVRALSERLQTPAIYLRTPTYAFRIGGLTVNRDGSITGEDEALLESLRPMLIERGWLEEEPVEAENSKAEAEGENIAPNVEEAARAYAETADTPNNAENAPAADSEAQISAPVERVDITTPLPDWTVAQMVNLLRTLYSKQYLLNRMMQGETLYIEEPFVAALTDSPPASVTDFEARVQDELEAGRIRGIAFEAGKFIFSTPYCPEEPTRWMVYSKLLDGILRSAKTAKRVSIRHQVTPENEKYHANSWLMRMGFGGAEHRELRRVLLRHLNGYAAFKSEADMQAHREKYAQLRRDFRDVSERADWRGGIQENRMSGEGVESDGTDHAG